MAQVIFKIGEETHEVELPAGERLLQGAYKLGLDEQGFGECGGNCVCSTCHVFVEEGQNLFKERSEAEEELLETVPVLQENSRLACQLEVSSDHDRIVVNWANA